MTDRARLEQALIAADRAGDTEAARTLAAALRSMPTESAQPADPRASELPSLEPQTPSPEPSMFRGVGRYLDRVGQANERAMASYSPLGSLEAAGTLLTGAVAAPILGTMVGIDDMLAGREPDPDEAFARFTYQPRTQSGKDQLAYLGALASPITESGADVALGPLAATESRAVGSAKVAPNAGRNPPRVRPGGDPSPPLPSPAKAGKVDARLAQAPKAAPSIEELRQLKDAAYKRAEDAGITISEGSLKGLKTRIAKIRTNATLHPDTTAAIKEIFDAKGELSLSQLDELRQIANGAKASLKADDQRLAFEVVDTIDEYIENLSAKDVTGGKVADAAALKEARGYYARLKKSEDIQELFRRAEIKAGANYTQSGLENALRGEFKALALNKNRMRRFNAQERAAIERVAKGAPMENALRLIGKMAPTGTVSGMLGAIVSAAVPGGVALPLLGLGGRAAATKMTLRNANAAEELMRRGALEPAKTRNKLAEPTY